jgi:hypothetical protein
MRTKTILSMLVITAIALSAVLIMTATTVIFGLDEAHAGFPAPPGLPGLPGLPAPPGVNVHVNGFLPAPPGVHVQMDSGRPYYVERDRRVYMERERPRHYKKHKKYRDHDDRGRGRGHDRHDD